MLHTDGYAVTLRGRPPRSVLMLLRIAFAQILNSSWRDTRVNIRVQTDSFCEIEAASKRLRAVHQTTSGLLIVSAAAPSNHLKPHHLQVYRTWAASAPNPPTRRTPLHNRVACSGHPTSTPPSRLVRPSPNASSTRNTLYQAQEGR